MQLVLVGQKGLPCLMSVEDRHIQMLRRLSVARLLHFFPLELLSGPQFCLPSELNWVDPVFAMRQFTSQVQHLAPCLQTRDEAS